MLCSHILTALWGTCGPLRRLYECYLSRLFDALLAVPRIPHVLVQELGKRKVALLSARVQHHSLLKEPCMPEVSFAESLWPVNEYCVKIA